MVARTKNPALNEKTFADFRNGKGRMSIEGTVNKTIVLLLVLLVPAFFVWTNVDYLITSAILYPLIIGSVILGLILAITTIFLKRYAFITGPLYTFVEGIFIGAISVLAERAFPGIVIQAVGLTFGTLFALLLVYKSRLIKVTQNFRLGVAAATGGIFLVYMVSFIGGFFGFNIPFIHGSGLIGIGFSLFVVVIAALNLVLDFDFIENAAKKAPKYMEWYAAFGLMVTLIWLYIEVLRLLMKLRARR